LRGACAAPRSKKAFNADKEGDARRTRRWFRAADRPSTTLFIFVRSSQKLSSMPSASSVYICVFCVHRLFLSALKNFLCDAAAVGGDK
jgi:hypothetical protein